MGYDCLVLGSFSKKSWHHGMDLFFHIFDGFQWEITGLGVGCLLVAWITYPYINLGKLDHDLTATEAWNHDSF
jgi:hypothetical protein